MGMSLYFSCISSRLSIFGWGATPSYPCALTRQRAFRHAQSTTPPIECANRTRPASQTLRSASTSRGCSLIRRPLPTKPPRVYAQRSGAETRPPPSRRRSRPARGVHDGSQGGGRQQTEGGRSRPLRATAAMRAQVSRLEKRTVVARAR